jgi:hypothetical protein
MSHRDFGVPPVEHHGFRLGAVEEYAPEPGEEDDGLYNEEDEEIYNPISYERDIYPPDIDDWGNAEPDAYASPSPEPTPTPGPSGPTWEWPDESWPPRLPRRPSRPRWLIPGAIAAVAAVIGAAFALTGGGHGAIRSSSARSGVSRATATPATRASAVPAASAPALTMAQAQQVMDNYTTTNNAANAQMSGALLGSIETGSSYAIDTGAYREQRASKSAAYPPFGPKQAELFIPRQAPGAYPRWFVALVANADLASPGRIANTEYLLFTQAAPGAPWKNTLEPYVLKGGGTPTIATDSGGFAAAVGSGASGLSVPPGKIAAVTAKSLDGSGPVQNPGNLGDLNDLAFWHSRLPKGATAADRHAPDPGDVFGLRTLDGGALLFFTDTAEIRLTPPRGAVMHLTIPGFYSPGEGLHSAGVGYLEQFAVYDPPHGGTGLRVVADYSGITARN